MFDGQEMFKVEVIACRELFIGVFFIFKVVRWVGLVRGQAVVDHFHLKKVLQVIRTRVHGPSRKDRTLLCDPVVCRQVGARLTISLQL